MQIGGEAREVALDSRLEILIHHRLVSLVVGLNSHVHSFGTLLPSGLAVVVTRSKQSRVFNEELRILVVCAVIGVGVDDQLRVRDVLLLMKEFTVA